MWLPYPSYPLGKQIPMILRNQELQNLNNAWKQLPQFYYLGTKLRFWCNNLPATWVHTLRKQILLLYWWIYQISYHWSVSALDFVKRTSLGYAHVILSQFLQLNLQLKLCCNTLFNSVLLCKVILQYCRANLSSFGNIEDLVQNYSN